MWMTVRLALLHILLLASACTATPNDTVAAPVPAIQTMRLAEEAPNSALWLWLNYDGLGWNEAGVSTVLPFGMKLSDLPDDRYTLDYISESPNDQPVGSGCESVSLERFPGITLMFEDGLLTRIDAFRPVELNPDPSNPAYTVGFGALPVLGRNWQALQSAIGEPAEVLPHPYLGEAGHYVIYNARYGWKRSLVLETEGDRVTGFRTGEFDSVRYIEGCL